jgi:hypothetical protein
LSLDPSLGNQKAVRAAPAIRQVPVMRSRRRNFAQNAIVPWHQLCLQVSAKVAFVQSGLSRFPANAGAPYLRQQFRTEKAELTSKQICAVRVGRRTPQLRQLKRVERERLGVPSILELRCTAFKHPDELSCLCLVGVDPLCAHNSLRVDHPANRAVAVTMTSRPAI